MTDLARLPIRALFLIEDGSYKTDSRVRRETATLRSRGVNVTVVCPAHSADDLKYYVEDDVHVFQYHVRHGSGGFFGHLGEYLTSLWWQTVLVARIFFKRGFDVIHAANPPDLLWLIALPYIILGKRFIFDHHDPVPELFSIRFGNRSRLLWIMTLLEKISLRLADHVISINESCRLLAINRGGKYPEDVTVVRNGPRLGDFPKVDPDEVVRGLGTTVVGFLGHVNPQDDLDVFIEMAHVIRTKRRREDVAFVIVGSGTATPKIKELRDGYGLGDVVMMPGQLPWHRVLSVLGAVDICVQPDLPNRFTHSSTMNKLMEYMALGKAVVSFDLVETRISAGDAIVYARFPTADSLAEAVLCLADDPERRRSLAEAGRRRVEQKLAWHHQAAALVSVYEKLFPGRLAPVLTVT